MASVDNVPDKANAPVVPASEGGQDGKTKRRRGSDRSAHVRANLLTLLAGEPRQPRPVFYTEPREAAVLVFPCRNGKTWELTRSRITEWARQFKTEHVDALSRGMLAWVEGHPHHVRLTGKMEGALERWIARRLEETPPGSLSSPETSTL